MATITRRTERDKRHARLRRKLHGSAERPRLNVFKSHKNLYLQVIDDATGHTLVAVSTQESDVKGSLKSRGSVAAAKAVGALVAQRSLAKGIKRVVFDRGGLQYQGAIKALATPPASRGWNSNAGTLTKE
jgi:large subunit ribosomal protein L18